MMMMMMMMIMMKMLKVIDVGENCVGPNPTVLVPTGPYMVRFQRWRNPAAKSMPSLPRVEVLPRHQAMHSSS